MSIYVIIFYELIFFILIDIGLLFFSELSFELISILRLMLYIVVKEEASGFVEDFFRIKVGKVVINLIKDEEKNKEYEL